MSDKFDWDIVARFAVEGAKAAGADIDEVKKSVESLYDAYGKAAGSSEASFGRQQRAAERQGRIYANLLEQQDKADLKRRQTAVNATDSLYRETRALSKQRGQQAADAWDQEFRALSNVTTEMSKLESPSLRYALYDISSTARNTALAITGIGTAAIVASASYEAAFTNAARTLEPGTYSVEKLREELMQLSREIPLSFQNISEIATLGNQLGIAGDDLAKFTETVAQFSSVSGMTVQETSLAFGQLGNLLGVLPEDYDRLGSAIALVGVRSAATETQIVSVARELAPAAAAAGFTAEQVIGLSGALGSMKVPPERSRSTILQFFETLNTAVASGGDSLDAFATVIGTTSGELEAMVRGGQGQAILERFIGRVSTADTIEVTQALQELGLAGLRTNPTIRALAGNMDLFQSTMADSKQGWTENTELARQFDMTVETLSSQWQLFLNALMGFGAAIGDNVAPAALQFLEIASDILITLTQFADSPLGSWISNTITFLGGLTAAFAAVIAVTAGVGASLVAVRFGLSQLGLTAVASQLSGAILGFFGLSRAAYAGAGGLNAARVALLGLGRATVVIGIIQLIANAFMDLAGTVNWAGEAVQNFGNFLEGLNLGGAFNNGAKQIQEFGKGISGWSRTLPGARNETEQFNQQIADYEARVAEAEKGTWDAVDAFEGFGDAADDAKDKTKGLAVEVRTLVDYSNDLSSVWSRAFDIRFSGQTTLDAITKTFNDMRQAAEDARQRIRELNADIGGLNSDLKIQQYFLGIAVEYGDTARAEAIQANIAKIQADLAKKNADLAAEQDKASKSLTGQTNAAIENRTSITGLISQYQSHIQALAASGLSTEELKARTEELEQDFIRQATQLGFNRQELGQYTQSFRDVRVAIDNVPRNINVDFNADPALQALNEFIARAKAATANLGTEIGNGIGRGMGNAIPGAAVMAFDVQKDALARSVVQTTLTAANNIISSLGGGGRPGSSVFKMPQLRGSFASGGYTGSGGKYEPAGVVHRGEYVVPKQYVNQRTGLPYADVMGRLTQGAPGRTGYSGGGFVRPAANLPNHIDSFGPMAQQQLQQALQNIITLDSGAIAGSVGRSNALSTSRGSA